MSWLAPDICLWLAAVAAWIVYAFFNASPVLLCLSLLALVNFKYINYSTMALEKWPRAAFALAVFRLLRTGRASKQTCSSIDYMYDKIIHTVLFMKYMHD